MAGAIFGWRMSLSPNRDRSNALLRLRGAVFVEVIFTNTLQVLLIVVVCSTLDD